MWLLPFILRSRTNREALCEHVHAWACAHATVSFWDLIKMHFRFTLDPQIAARWDLWVASASCEPSPPLNSFHFQEENGAELNYDNMKKAPRI